MLSKKDIELMDWRVAAYHEISHAAVAAILGASCVELHLGTKDEAISLETKSVKGSCRYLGLNPTEQATVAWAGIIGEFLHENGDSDLDDFDLYSEFLDGKATNPPSPTDQAAIDRVPKKKQDATCEAAWKTLRKHWRDIERMASKCEKAFSTDSGYLAMVEFDGRRVTLRSKY